jgi:sarcosine oxidase
MSTHTDLVIIGGGIMGCATAHAASRAGMRVTLLEQFSIGRARGSSHGPSRVIRLARDGTDYVALARASYTGWRALEAAAGRPSPQTMVGVYFGPPGTEAIEGIRATYRDTGVPYEEFDGVELMRRHPQIRVPPNGVAFASAARAAGALLLENKRVTLLSQLDLHLPLTITKEQATYFRVSDPAPYLPDALRLFMRRHRGNTVIGNAFPIFGGPRLKVILDRQRFFIDRESTDPSPDAGALPPQLGDDVVDTVTCRYTMTPDEHFVLDAHPVHRNIVIASPCSGHGFKFAPVLGDILFALAQGRDPGCEAHRYEIMCNMRNTL